MDLGLTPPHDLPNTLGGVEVMFNGVPAPVLRVSPTQIIVAVPVQVIAAREGAGFVSVQVLSNGVASNPMLMPVRTSLLGLLTRDFLNPQFHSNGAVDGYVRNADGTLNDADHPAAAGSIITLYGTGLGPTNIQVNPGSVAASTAVMPVTPYYSTWQVLNPPMIPPPLRVSSIPGDVSAMYQIQMTVPNPLPAGGAVLPNGAERVSVALLYTLGSSPLAPPASNIVSVYVW